MTAAKVSLSLDADVLADTEVESGPVPDDLLGEARQVWPGDERRGRRRST